MTVRALNTSAVSNQSLNYCGVKIFIDNDFALSLDSMRTFNHSRIADSFHDEPDLELTLKCQMAVAGESPCDFRSAR